jgi:hypothetical protein
MVKKRRRRKSRRDETLDRNVVISSIAPRFGIRMEDANDPDPLLEARPWLELRGHLLEPIRDVEAVKFSVWADPDWRVGTVRPSIRPTVEVICSLPSADFTYLWSLALSGRLTHAYMLFTKPRYSSASVSSLSFSSELEE